MELVHGNVQFIKPWVEKTEHYPFITYIYSAGNEENMYTSLESWDLSARDCTDGGLGCILKGIDERMMDESSINFQGEVGSWKRGKEFGRIELHTKSQHIEVDHSLLWAHRHSKEKQMST